MLESVLYEVIIIFPNQKSQSQSQNLLPILEVSVSVSKTEIDWVCSVSVSTRKKWSCTSLPRHNHDTCT